jgi:hypothetical protein
VAKEIFQKPETTYAKEWPTLENQQESSKRNNQILLFTEEIYAV